jgi:GntR family transcriptional regulator, transcriptional repressor for pyruvate dehydrogenase complex
MRTPLRSKPNTPKSFLTPVTRTTLTADICREIASHLIRGDWTNGDRIPPETELCRQLGVGRASLREAMKALEIMGMIETRLGDGTFVCHRSEFLSRPLLWAITSSRPSDLRELVEARCLIEVELAGFAAERAFAAELKTIRGHLDQMQASLSDADAFQKADVGFHLAIAAAAHNRVLHNALQLTRNLIESWIGRSLTQKGVADEALSHHKRIFLAIAAKDSEKAKAAMRRHLDKMAGHLIDTQISDAKMKAPTSKPEHLSPIAHPLWKIDKPRAARL